MDGQHLAIYIHDHLAGSTAAVNLMKSLEKDHAGRPVAKVVAQLRAEIEEERVVLTELAEKYPTATSIPRQSLAWLAVKGLQAKLALDERQAEDFSLFESLEALSLGIAGKRLLWRTLSQESRQARPLKGPDYKGLVARAVRQRRMLEPERLKAAASAEA